LRAFAALVVPWQEGELLLCDIEDRGWCIPSGRVEPFESSIDAAKREAVEEAGAILEDILYLGCYRICERNEVRWADIFTARVAELVDIPEEFESAGRQFVTVAQLPEIYYLWNSLTEAVILHARSVMERHLGR
jgi:8-oxo-dGTP diphosphatase